jgi:hypothetical protein
MSRKQHRVLLELPCGHRVDLAGHGAAPEVDDPWFRMADGYLTEEQIDPLHRAITRWKVHAGKAVAESVTFMHGGSDGDPLLHVVGTFRGQAAADGWHMYLEPVAA